MVVDADSLAEAVTKTWLAGCNPGGEIKSMALTPDMKRAGPPAEVARFARFPRLTLLSRTQLEAAGAVLVTSAEVEGDD